LPCDSWQRRGSVDNMVSDMEVCMKQRCEIYLLHSEKMAPIDICQCLLNKDRDQTVNVRTVRWWVVHFSSGNSNSGLPLLVQISINGACRLLFIVGAIAQLVMVDCVEK